MYKRFFAILFILFANIIMLVHVLVPHHHHKTEVCLSKTDCIPNRAHEPLDKQDCSEHAEEEHTHDDKSQTNFCLLNSPLILPSKKMECLTSPFFYLHTIFIYRTIQSTLRDADLITSVSLLYGKLAPPNNFHLYTMYASNYIGFRAPPIL